MHIFVCPYTFSLLLLENCKQFFLFFILELILSFLEEFAVMVNLMEIINAVRKWQGRDFLTQSFQSVFEILMLGYFKPNELLKA